MLERALIAGSGGQGIILTGKLLATVASDTVPHVTFYPAYGAEVRGGTSNCQVILSSAEIASPVTDVCESMLLMNQESVTSFMPRAGKHSLMILNSSLCKAPAGRSVVSVDATRRASEMGDIRVANLVMLGAYIARKPVVSPDDMAEGIRRLLAGRNPSLIGLNIRAFRLGLTL